MTVVTDKGARVLSERSSARVVNDVHGLATFKSEPRPVFATGSLKLQTGRAGDYVLKLLALAREDGTQFESQRRVAFSLFSASIGLEPADARFVMLMMAVETMILPEPRPRASRDHVDALVDVTKTATLNQSERASIAGTLRWLYDESISQAERRLAGTLGDRSYGSKMPSRFFTDCYSLRSSLVHGYVPRPTFSQINSVVGELERFTRDLLVGDLIAANARTSRSAPRESPS